MLDNSIPEMNELSAKIRAATDALQKRYLRELHLVVEDKSQVRWPRTTTMKVILRVKYFQKAVIETFRIHFGWKGDTPQMSFS